MKDRFTLVIPCMKGGGAERVLSLLGNELSRRGNDVEMLLTSTDCSRVQNNDLEKHIPIRFLQEEISAEGIVSKLLYGLLGIYARVFCKLFEVLGKAVPATLAYVSFQWVYHREVKALREYIVSHPENKLIVFLQPAIPMVLLAARELPNKVVISERGDSRRLMKHRYGGKFLEKYYQRADALVCQSQGALSFFPSVIRKLGTVISNPLKSGLPEPYHGKRRKEIVTFCRISPEKNLVMLFEALVLLRRNYPEYKLVVYGDAILEAEKEYLNTLKELVDKLGLTEDVAFRPFCKDVHSQILKSAMYVNTSNYEGMCNAMLESLSIGLPCVCTDCPPGGARFVIKDHENGLLVPVGDVKKLAAAMKELAENPELGERLSGNGQKLRAELSLENIGNKWEELLQ